MSKKSEKNLISLADRSPEERRAIGAKGGRASQEKLRKRRTQKEYLELALDIKIKNIPQLKRLGEKMGLDIDEATLQELLTLKLLLNTANFGSVGSLKDIIQILGEQQETAENNGVLNELTKYLKGEKNAK